jgi:hypothetical protein
MIIRRMRPTAKRQFGLKPARFGSEQSAGLPVDGNGDKQPQMAV